MKEDLKEVETPSKKGDKVLCHINGQSIKGVIFNDDISGGNVVAILLDEKIEGGRYLQGYGVTLGVDLLEKPSKIQKIGVATEIEMETVSVKVNALSSY